jgi:predicted porin
MKKTLTIFLVILFSSSMAQEKTKTESEGTEVIVNSKPYNTVGLSNSIITNPSYSGLEESHVINLFGTWDKPMFDISPGFYYPVNYGLSYNAAIGKKKNNGIGIYGSNRFSGVEFLVNAGLTYSYNFRIKQEHNLRLGLGINFEKGYYNYDSLIFPDQIERRHGFAFNTSELIPDSNEKTHTNASIGLFYTYQNLYTGLSFNNFMQFTGFFNSKPKINPEIVFYLGYNFKITNHGIFPSASFQFKDKVYYITPAINYSYKNIVIAGINIKNFSAPGVVAGVNLFKTIFVYASCNAFTDKKRIEAFGYIESVAANIKLSFGKKSVGN